MIVKILFIVLRKYQYIVLRQNINIHRGNNGKKTDELEYSDNVDNIQLTDDCQNLVYFPQETTVCITKAK